MSVFFYRLDVVTDVVVMLTPVVIVLLPTARSADDLTIEEMVLTP